LSSLAPFVDEADRQHEQEQHHRPEPVHPHVAQHHRPGKQERHLEVEDDEQDRDQVEAHVEAPARVLERGKAAFVGRQFLGVGALPAGDQGQRDRCPGNRHRDPEEYQDRQVFAQHRVHSALSL
jgi:hypothetical protein